MSRAIGAAAYRNDQLRGFDINILIWDHSTIGLEKEIYLAQFVEVQVAIVVLAVPNSKANDFIDVLAKDVAVRLATDLGEGAVAGCCASMEFQILEVFDMAPASVNACLRGDAKDAHKIGTLVWGKHISPCGVEEDLVW